MGPYNQQAHSLVSAGLKPQFSVLEMNILHLIIFKDNFAINKKYIKEVFKLRLLLSLKMCLHFLLHHSVTFLLFHSEISFPTYWLPLPVCVISELAEDALHLVTTISEEVVQCQLQ